MNKEIKDYFDYMSTEDINGWLKVAKRRKKTVKALFHHFRENNFNFSVRELHQIYLGLCNGLAKEKIMIYATDKFNDTQMSVIRDGLEIGYSVKEVRVYAKPELSHKKMMVVLEALINGVNIQKLKPYINSIYGCNRLKVISKAIITNEPRMDLIANPEYSADYMEAIRESLIEYRESNVEYYIERYLKKKFFPSQLYTVLGYACECPGEYTNRQLDFIANPKFNEEQMHEIARGFRCGFDYEKVKIYAKPEINGVQMCKIIDALWFDRLSIEQIKPYIKPWFDGFKLEKIFKGLREGLDVSLYAKKDFSLDQMSVIFNALEEKVSKKKIATILDSRIASDNMSIILELFEKGVTVDQIKQILSKEHYLSELNELCRKQASIIRNKALNELEMLLS